MNRQNYRNTFIIAATAIAAASISPPAWGQISPSDPLCRQVVRPSEGLAIRRNPNTGSAQIGGAGVGERVLLTTNPATIDRNNSSGRTWVQVSRPAAGWLSNGIGTPTNLSVCADGPTPPPPPPSRCRRVINPSAGLVIRRDANASSPVVGGIGLNGRMTITTTPPTTSRDSQGRTWVEIEAPARGWVSNGLGGQSNIGVCP